MANDPAQKPEKKQEDQVAELNPKAVTLEQFDVSRKEAKNKVKSEMDKLKSGIKGTVFNWNADNLLDKYLYAIDDKAAVYKEKAKGKTLTELTALKTEMDLELKTDVKNIIALLNRMTNTEFYIQKEELARLEVYTATIKFMMKTPEAKPLVDIFSEMMSIQTVGKYQKVLEKGILSPSIEIAILAMTILGLAKDSVKDEFIKNFIAAHPDRALKVLMFGNKYGTYSAFDVKKYYKYAIDTYTGKPGAEYKKALDEFIKKDESFDNDSKNFQASFLLQQQIKDREKALGQVAYGEDAVSRLRPEKILMVAGEFVADGALLANYLANRPMLTQKYKDEGLFAAIKAYVTMPYPAAALAFKFGKNIFNSDEKLGEVIANNTEKDAKANMRGLKRFQELVERYATWGMFLNEGGLEELVAYQKHLNGKTGLEAEPTIEGFKAFLDENEKNQASNTRPSRYLGKDVLEGKLPAEETANLKTYLNLMKEYDIQNKAAFNKKLDEARQNI